MSAWLPRTGYSRRTCRRACDSRIRERSTLAEIGKRLGRKALAEVTCVAKPDTILAWYRRLIARKFDGSKRRRDAGRPRIGAEVEALVIRFARENSGWGYDRIVGALANPGHGLSDQTAGNILRRHGIAPAPKRSQNTTWADFIRSHLAVLAGVDFFTAEVLTWHGLVTYYVLFFIHLDTRRVSLGGFTRHPNEVWMQQMARNATAMYRVLEKDNATRERRDQLVHPPYQKPELLATAPNQLWSWDITKLRGPAKWTYFGFIAKF